MCHGSQRCVWEFIIGRWTSSWVPTANRRCAISRTSSTRSVASIVATGVACNQTKFGRRWLASLLSACKEFEGQPEAVGRCHECVTAYGIHGKRKVVEVGSKSHRPLLRMEHGGMNKKLR